MNENDEKLVSDIKESLNYLDSRIDFKPPDLACIGRMISKGEQIRRTKQRRELALFIGVDILLLSLVLCLLLRFPAAFIVVQAASLVIFPCIFTIWLRKHDRQVDTQ